MHNGKKLLAIAALLLLSTCKKDQQYVPDAYVSLTIYVNDPQNAAISVIGGWKYFDGGYRGIVIYRKSQNEFLAYDRTCPFEPEKPASVVAVDTSNNVLLKDHSCGSQFLLSDGTPASGQAVIALKQYRTTFDGTILRVSN